MLVLPEALSGVTYWLNMLSWRTLKEKGRFVLQSAGSLAIYSYIQNASNNMRILCTLKDGLGEEYVVARGDELDEMMQDIEFLYENVEPLLDTVESLEDLESIIEQVMEKQNNPSVAMADDSLSVKGFPLRRKSSDVLDDKDERPSKQSRTDLNQVGNDDFEEIAKSVNLENDLWKLLTYRDDDRYKNKRGVMALIEQRFSTLLLQWLESNPSTTELLNRRKDLLSRTQRNGDVAFEKQVIVLLESEVVAREVQLIQNTTDIKQLWLKRESITSGKDFDEETSKFLLEKLNAYLVNQLWKLTIGICNSNEALSEFRQFLSSKQKLDEVETNILNYFNRMIEYNEAIQKQQQQRQQTETAPKPSKNNTSSKDSPSKLPPPPAPMPPPLPKLPSLSQPAPQSLAQSLAQRLSNLSSVQHSTETSTSTGIVAKAKLIKMDFLTSGPKGAGGDSDSDADDWEESNSEKTSLTFAQLIQKRCPEDWVHFVGSFDPERADTLATRYAFIIQSATSPDMGRLVIQIPASKNLNDAFSIVHLSVWSKSFMKSALQCALNQVAFLKQVLQEQQNVVNAGDIIVEVIFELQTHTTSASTPPKDLVKELQASGFQSSTDSTLFTCKYRRAPQELTQFDRMIYHPKFAW